MIIGIVSDTHGHADVLRAALRMLAGRGAQTVVHCGDVGSTQCIRALGESGMSAYAVAGNMDRHVQRLSAAAARVGVHFSGEAVEAPIDQGRRLAATHGQDEALLQELILGRQFPYVCHGHWHRTRDERIGPVRVINPGALHNARQHTVAILDTQADTLEFITVG